MPIIRKIEAKPALQKPKLKVAAYARVSMESDNLLHSLSAQVSYYSSYIQSRTDWEYVGVYADQGISGTSTRNRLEFKRMLDDCNKGKINLILVKSISRFARDTVDCLNTIRYLRTLNVAVQFERERINTLTAEGEFLLTLLAAFAQAESRSISENVRWAIRKGFKEGKQNGYKTPYGYFWDGSMYRITPEQGNVVKEIFARYLSGESAYGIARDLAKKGVTGQTGTPLEQTSVKDMLSNISYTGTLLLQREFITENKKRRTNHGELPMYQVDGMFEPLVSVNDFAKAQTIRQERANAMPNKNPQLTMFSGLINCGCCGFGVSRRTRSKRKVWVCNNQERNSTAACKVRPLQESELIEATKKALNRQELDSTYFKARVERIELYSDSIDFVMEKGVIKTIQRKFNGGRGSNPFTSKVLCGSCGCKCGRDTYPQGYKVWGCTSALSQCHRERIKESELIVACKDVLGESYEGVVVRYVKAIHIYMKKVVFEFYNGDDKEWQRE